MAFHANILSVQELGVTILLNELFSNQFTRWIIETVETVGNLLYITFFFYGWLVADLKQLNKCF